MGREWQTHKHVRTTSLEKEIQLAGIETNHNDPYIILVSAALELAVKIDIEVEEILMAAGSNRDMKELLNDTMVNA